MGRRKARRSLLYRPSKKPVAFVPPEFAEVISFAERAKRLEERRVKQPLPDWAAPASAFRPTTREFTAAADNIAEINYKAWRGSKRTQAANCKSWSHWRSTTPNKRRRHNREPKPKFAASEPQLVFKTSWLEPVVDESVKDAEFEAHLRDNGPTVRLLHRTMRRKQKQWQKQVGDYKNRLPGIRAKPRRWIPRSDPKVKLRAMPKWLARHGRGDIKDKVIEETKEAIRAVGRRGKKKGKLKKRHHGQTEKRNRGTTNTNRAAPQFFGQRPSGWFKQNADLDPPGRLRSSASHPLLSRSQALPASHPAKAWPGGSQRWQSPRSQVAALPPLLPCFGGGIISGGRRYVSPLLLAHEQPVPSSKLVREPRGPRGWRR